MRLVTSSQADPASILEMAEACRAAGEDRYAAALADLDGFLERIGREEHQEHCRPGFVAQTWFWLVDGEDRVLGSCRLRHRLAPHLEVEGGHIGYDVRPDARGRGHGTRMLALALQEARQRGLETVLVTCDDDNEASARIIERNGGVRTSSTVSPRSSKVVRRYWIDLA